MLRGLLCVGKVCYPELGAGHLTVPDAIELLLQCSQTYPTQTSQPKGAVSGARVGQLNFSGVAQIRNLPHLACHRAFRWSPCSALGRFVIPSWIVPMLVGPSLALPFEPRLNGWVRLPLQLRYVPC